ncbi:YybH family protein [Microlunatus speluncae]|uniref:YybH family protein n=1 Tax=Microlunatus speluncae TaxID=2594267 RepID=UPI0012667FEF|nr:DUF4440 domain-containing protein [Microlunatus speluncae]
MTDHGLDEVVTAYRDALRVFITGDPTPALSFMSDRDDVTLANPLGPPRRGPAGVSEVARNAAANFQQGAPLHFDEVTSRFDEISRYATADLGYVVQIEHFEGRLTGGEDPVTHELRVTVIFRREDGTWKICHRHADPITAPRPTSTLIQD